MIKKSASRNQRSKGAKVKNVLQVLLLLCICFWLLYQIKRSYDRKRDLTEKDSRTLVQGNDEGGGLNLGRKDLRAKRQEEEDENEGKDEDGDNQGERDDVEVDEDEIRREIERNEERERLEGQKDEDDEEAGDNHEEDDGREEEEDNSKMDEVEDEATDPEEDFLDEDKGGREERVVDEGEENNGGGRREEHVREDNRSEDKDQDEVHENSHEAREVHYRADDASSAVAHDTGADNGNADLGSNKPGMESNSTMSNPHDLNQESVSLKWKESEAAPGNPAEGKSNVSEVVDNQASNVTSTGGMELAGSVSNVSKTVISLPQAQNLTTPDSGSDVVSLEQASGVKMDNASPDEKATNVSAMTNSSNKTDTTPSTSSEEPYKPLAPLNNQTTAVSDRVTNLTGAVNDNVIKMQLPDKPDGAEAENRTQ